MLSLRRYFIINHLIYIIMVYLSDDNFMRIVDNGNDCCSQPKVFKIFNQNTKASMKANLGGILASMKWEALTNDVNASWGNYIELIRQTRLYQFTTIVEVLNFMHLMKNETCPFKPKAAVDILADQIRQGFCKEEIGNFTPGNLNLLFDENIANVQEGSEPWVIWLDNKPVWRGTAFDDKAYAKLAKTTAVNNRLFLAVVLNP